MVNSGKETSWDSGGGGDGSIRQQQAEVAGGKCQQDEKPQCCCGKEENMIYGGARTVAGFQYLVPSFCVRQTGPEEDRAMPTEAVTICRHDVVSRIHFGRRTGYHPGLYESLKIGATCARALVLKCIRQIGSSFLYKYWRLSARLWWAGAS